MWLYNTCRRLWLQTNRNATTHTRTHTQTHKHLHTHASTHPFTETHYTFTHAHTFTHTCTYPQTQTFTHSLPPSLCASGLGNNSTNFKFLFLISKELPAGTQGCGTDNGKCVTAATCESNTCSEYSELVLTSVNLWTLYGLQ